MRRREFITLLGGAAAAWPLAARAQQPAMPVIGFSAPVSKEFHTCGGIRRSEETGYVEGRNVAIEFRWAEYQNDRLSALAADLVRPSSGCPRRTPAEPSCAVRPKALTTTIPIVFGTGGDPVSLGFVSSLNRPDRNLTGVYQLLSRVGGKAIGAPARTSPDRCTDCRAVEPEQSQMSRANARTLRRRLALPDSRSHILPAATQSDLDEAFADVDSIARRGAACRRRSLLQQPPRPIRLDGGASRNSGNLRSPRVCRGWRLDELRDEPGRQLSPTRRLFRKDLQGRQARRSAGRTVL